jgi:hypothetical protein
VVILENRLSTFSHNEACPRCGSRDNVAVYDDGHKWCFGCSYYVPAVDTLKSLQRRFGRQGEEQLDGNGIDTSLFNNKIPERALKWLSKYGVTERERYFHNILWCDLRQTLVFPVIRDGKVTLTNERYFGNDPKHPKYLTFGNKSREILVLQGPAKRTLVLVEDFISALKASRVITSIPLFGTTCPESVLEWAPNHVSSIGVWLDLDKASEALREASRLSQRVPTVAVLSQMDPKEYTVNQMTDILKSYKLVT